MLLNNLGITCFVSLDNWLHIEMKLVSYLV